MEGKDPTQRWIILGLASSRFPVLLYVPPEISQGVHEQFLWELSQDGSWVGWCCPPFLPLSRSLFLRGRGVLLEVVPSCSNMNLGIKLIFIPVRVFGVIH